jgi:hypothetical protein
VFQFLQCLALENLLLKFKGKLEKMGVTFDKHGRMVELARHTKPAHARTDEKRAVWLFWRGGVLPVYKTSKCCLGVLW